jgi:mannobiose 2-epimerase
MAAHEITPEALADAVQTELTSDIIPFWLRHSLDEKRGGFIARMSHDLVVDPAAPKGLILNARILWSFSAFHRRLGDRACLAAAERARAYIEEHFWDTDHGGAYWMVDGHGRPLDTKKKAYGQAFLIYALAEHHRATGSAAALTRAQELFELLEAKVRDAQRGGYLETFERDWSTAEDLRLSDADLNVTKSMNAHLHVLEAYAGLYRAWPDSRLRKSLSDLIEIFLRHIIDPHTHHLRLFFDEDWTVRAEEVSFGHDIEASWLLWEAAEVLGDVALLSRVRDATLAMADAVLREGVEADGGLPNVAQAGTVTDSDRDWWPQAEAVVGFLNAYELSGERRFWDAAVAAWRFIEAHIIDRRHGEWFWSVSRDGRPDLTEPKISEWKCPYHNGRMCLEVLDRIERLGARDAATPTP